jgi:hypothetical protein
MLRHVRGNRTCRIEGIADMKDMGKSAIEGDSPVMESDA